MENLQNMQFEPISKYSQALSSSEIQDYKAQLPAEWELIEENGEQKLRRNYRFNSFLDALIFTDTVGNLAESENHHPILLTEWGNVTVTWWTHKIHGLHQNDFIMAARTEGLYHKT